MGATDGFVLSNTIGRNAHRVGGDCIKAVIDGYTDFCKLLDGYGVGITMSGGETADVGDLVATIIADSTFLSVSSGMRSSTARISARATS